MRNPFLYFLVILLNLAYVPGIFSQACSNLNLELKAEIPSSCVTMTMTMMHDQQTKPYLYVANKEAGLKIYNITTISAPSLVATVPISLLESLEVISLTQQGNYVYLALGNIFNNSQFSGMAIVDVANPEIPIVKDVWHLDASSGGAGIVKVEGDYAYLGAMGNGLVILNIQNKSNIVMESQFIPDINYPVPNPPIKSFYNARGMEVKNNIVYLCYDAGGIRIIDVSNKSKAVEIGEYANPEYNNIGRAYNNAVLDDSLLYVAIDFCGIEVLNVKDAKNIKLTGRWNPYNCPDNKWGSSPVHANELQLNKNCKLLFVSTGKSDLHVLDVSDPTSPDSCNIYGGVDNGIGTWGIGLYKDQIYLSYICAGIPFPSNWTGVKLLNYLQCSTTAVNDQQFKGISVYPTPSADAIFIDNNDDAFKRQSNIKMSICNLVGQTVMLIIYEKLPNVINLDISLLKDGMYIIKIDAADLSWQQKIIKTTNRL